MKTFFLIAIGLSFVGNAYADTTKPNVIFILVDDMGYMDIACNGSMVYETPNIDALAKSGMRFTQAYAPCGVCSPSRHAIMSGKYPARSGCTNYALGVFDCDWLWLSPFIGHCFDQS